MEPTNVLLVDDLPENLRALNALVRADDRVIYQARTGLFECRPCGGQGTA